MDPHLRTEERLAEAKAQAERALQLAIDLPEAHLALGLYYYWGKLDFDRALQHFTSALRHRPADGEFTTEAIELAPREATAYYWKLWGSPRTGLRENAASSTGAAVELDRISDGSDHTPVRQHLPRR
jgi:tetratricopeptide (TPR) repeat protein